MTTSEQEASTGLYAKYEVRKHGDPVEDCFVLEPSDDPAARAALRAYASATDNEELEADLREQYGLEKTSKEEWEEHNEPFNYEPPELPGDAWPVEEYRRLYDRIISRRTEWFCDKCTGRGPIRTLEKARKHVESNHGRDLIEKYETPRDEQDTATDGGTSQDEIDKRQSQNLGLGDFSE